MRPSAIIQSVTANNIGNAMQSQIHIIAQMNFI